MRVPGRDIHRAAGDTRQFMEPLGIRISALQHFSNTALFHQRNVQCMTSCHQ